MVKQDNDTLTLSEHNSCIILTFLKILSEVEIVVKRADNGATGSGNCLQLSWERDSDGLWPAGGAAVTLRSRL